MLAQELCAAPGFPFSNLGTVNFKSGHGERNRPVPERQGARPNEFPKQLKAFYPSGKSLPFYRNHVKPPDQKYFSSVIPKYLLHPRHLILSTRGVSRSLRTLGWVAVDAEVPKSERHGSVRRSRVVLTPRCWRRRWQQCKAHRGDHVISRKAIAQGMSDALRFTCMLVCASTISIARETAGAARTRHSLLPRFWGKRISTTRALGCGIAEVCVPVIPGAPRSASIRKCQSSTAELSGSHAIPGSGRCGLPSGMIRKTRLGISRSGSLRAIPE